ncbi:CLUMA_CG014736, isoform A [Clunio marinus]|uniref:CLUMA_CG014736, isoform A n=1 Tax=Clunio marinus TaxID=568069 RepID=A0A1J1IML0_9DIPT|nr:CLUMA_CG014736, isoform A [Clunio marinus]
MEKQTCSTLITKLCLYKDEFCQTKAKQQKYLSFCSMDHLTCHLPNHSLKKAFVNVSREFISSLSDKMIPEIPILFFNLKDQRPEVEIARHHSQKPT